MKIMKQKWNENGARSDQKLRKFPKLLQKVDFKVRGKKFWLLQHLVINKRNQKGPKQRQFVVINVAITVEKDEKKLHETFSKWTNKVLEKWQRSQIKNVASRFKENCKEREEESMVFFHFAGCLDA